MKHTGSVYVVRFGELYLSCDAICTLNSVKLTDNILDATVCEYRSQAMEFGDRAAYILARRRYTIIEGNGLFEIQHKEQLRKSTHDDSVKVPGVYERDRASGPIS